MPHPRVSQYRLGHYPPGELVTVLLFFGCVFGVLGAAALALLGVPPLAHVPSDVRALLYAAAAAGLACIAYGVLIEPFSLTVLRVELPTPKVEGEPLRIVHLSDFHVRRFGKVEAQLVDTVRALAPDAVLVTGDMAAKPGRASQVRRLMEGLASAAPVYCTRGNREFQKPSFEKYTEGTACRWLLGETERLKLKGTTVSLTGVCAGDEEGVRSLGRKVPESDLSICLYHYPDLVPETARLPYDLMLAGHTHGGQVRLPLIGPLISHSRSGRRYAAGLFRFGRKAALVTQGIGCESYGLPRIRFLCPPELALLVFSRPSKRSSLSSRISRFSTSSRL